MTFMRDLNAIFTFQQVLQNTFLAFKTAQPTPWYHGCKTTTIQEFGKPIVIISCSQARQAASGQQLCLAPANLGEEITVSVQLSQWHF